VSQYWVTCDICDGAGKLEDESGDDVLSMTVCPRCGGTGRLPVPPEPQLQTVVVPESGSKRQGGVGSEV